jgi:hypothetical protein
MGAGIALEIDVMVCNDSPCITDQNHSEFKIFKNG